MRALRDLPEAFKTVVFLADVQGYQYAEIAEIMGTPIGTVMSRIHRGRRMLRAALVDGGAVPAARRPVQAEPQSGQPIAPSQVASPRVTSPQAVRPRRELPAPGAVAAAASLGSTDRADTPLAA